MEALPAAINVGGNVMYIVSIEGSSQYGEEGTYAKARDPYFRVLIPKVLAASSFSRTAAKANPVLDQE